MRHLSFLAALAIAAVPALAQESETTEVQIAPRASELDILSRNADDPFAGVIKAERREPISVTLRALDKITARYLDIEAPMNEIAKFGSLELIPRTCDTRPPEEFPETTVFLEVYDTELTKQVSNLRPRAGDALEDEISSAEIAPLDVAPAGKISDAGANAAPPVIATGPQAEGINIFRGWMFASSPALNALEHAVYDVWVIDCKTRIAGS